MPPLAVGQEVELVRQVVGTEVVSRFPALPVREPVVTLPLAAAVVEVLG